MLDGNVPGEVEPVWGFVVPTMPNGRRKWLEAFCTMAVERKGRRQILRDRRRHRRTRIPGDGRGRKSQAQ